MGVYQGEGGQATLSRDMQALWVTMASENPTAALITPHNLYATNIKVKFAISITRKG